MINKLVYSHWSKPAKGTHVGFNSEAMFIASLYLSVKQNTKWIKNVQLVTDRAGEELIVNKYKIPFTSVLTTLDSINHIDKRHWALGKLEACRAQTTPFMHIDNDVFWFKRIPEYLRTAQACFQNKEVASTTSYQFYTDLCNHAKHNFEKAKPFVNYDRATAVNCGIMGFNDLSFIEEWANHAYEYIEYYDRLVLNSSIGFKMSSIIFEQVHMNEFLNHYNFKVEYVSGNEHSNWVTTDRAKEVGYTHLISGSKRSHAVEEKVISRLEHDWPDFYKILKDLNQEDILEIENRYHGKTNHPSATCPT